MTNSEKLRKWKEYCPICKKNHIVWMQSCSECGINKTPQPSEKVKCSRNYYYVCDGCQSYLDHLR